MRSSSARNLVVPVIIILTIHPFEAQAERKLRLHNLVKVEEDTEVVETNLSIIEVDGNVFKINGELKINSEVDDNFEMGVEVQRSEKHDWDYESVFYVDKIGVCSFLNTYYKEFFYERLEEYSNAPVPSTCPLPEGAHYHLKDYPLDVTLLKTLLKPGHYRIEFTSMLNNDFNPLIYLVELEVYD
ncbi:uncharacterized protein LOC108031040 [Drosophila biarmipes]|uniref:uncharacterized protein LOC108031040 n=1 Tax=Drosophila biarmipes TaxID=125945 RepID=UPI0007E7320B|nr:uncharacterized protein LOC108031040 [Drosophila biarmipes]